VVSPDVLPDRRVTFRLLAPKAAEVTLTGEFLPASADSSGPPSLIRMTKGADGLWTTTVGPVEPETYHYHFTVDGVRTLDPGNPDLKTGSTPATIMNVLVVPGDQPAFYDGRAVPHGEIRTHWYESTSLGTLRRMTVYVPPGYDRSPATRYPVLYLLHGANADETAWTRFGRVNLILDNLLADKRAVPFVVVMPFGYGVPPMGTGVQAQNTAKFSEDLRQDVLPFVEGRYRVHADRDHRAIAGLSMGGGQALSIGLNHLELFSHVAGFSAALGSANDFSKPYASLIANAAASNRTLRLLWVGCGTSDSLFGASKNFSTFLNEHRITHVFRATDGAHTWMVWRRYLNELAPMLFR
jgi:enterochelin esterase family protein